jgi:pimeloyl-ACP methyl ester carboxylesterase
MVGMLDEGHVNLPDGRSVAWCEWGDADGSPIVLLHGTPGSRFFLADPTTSSPPGLRVLTLDRPGYGRSSPPALRSVSGVAEIVGRLADDRGFRRFPVVGFSGGVPFALACGAVLNDRVSRIAAVSGQGPIDELTDAYAALSSAEREMVSEIRRDPAAATELLWEHGQWYPETPLRMLDRPPDAGDESVLNDPVIRANLVASNLEGARQGQAGLIADWVSEALPWGFSLADISVHVDVWVGGLDPGRATLDAPELERRIASCTVHLDADAGHWLITRWADIVGRALL